MPSIAIAYYIAKNTDVTPDEYLEHFQSLGYAPELACADEECRRQFPDTRIAAICCVPESPCSKQSPHFRTFPKHDHGENCRYFTFQKYTDYVLGHKEKFKHNTTGINLLLDMPGIDSSLVPDEYVLAYEPREMIKEIENKAIDYIRGGRGKKDAYQTAIATVPHKTGSLERIVKISEIIETNFKKTENTGMQIPHSMIPLAIPGRPKTTYFSAFFQIRYVKESYDNYIFYDSAVIKKKENGFLIKYTKPIENYDINNPGIPKEIWAVTFITDEALRNRTDKHIFKKRLEDYANSGEECCVYSYSTHLLAPKNCPDSERNFCVVIEPRTLADVVIRKRCVKRFKNKQF